MKGIVGRKIGMTQLFDEESGEVTAVTVIEAGPCPVVQLKTAETDGYEAVQLAFEEVPERKVSKPRIGHLKKTDTKPHRHLVEFRGTSEAVVGEPVTVEVFEPGDKVKVTGISIGKGFAGTIKRGPVTHGSHNIRKRGSVGSSATPSRVMKGMKMAGQMGAKRRTQVGLTVHSVDSDQNLLLVKGAIPGPKNGVVEIREEKRGGGS
jgi:large subunit ribosomal protein L3